MEEALNQDLSQEQVSPNESQDQAPQVVELDSLEKFKWAGRELTPRELQNMVLMQSDYTRKTQALSEERKYYDNLEADLENVRKNPVLAQQFRTIYPEKFHKFLNYGPLSQTQAPQNGVGNNQELSSLASRFDQVERQLHEQRVQAIDAELDARFKVLSEKYPLADEEAVLARAQALLNDGTTLTDQVWDKLWKSVNDRNMGLAQKHYSTLVNKQKQANGKARGVGAGGGIPGSAPKNPRTIKEASNALLAELENS